LLTDIHPPRHSHFIVVPRGHQTDALCSPRPRDDDIAEITYHLDGRPGVSGRCLESGGGKGVDD